jgi:hypothetical protein
MVKVKRAMRQIDWRDLPSIATSYDGYAAQTGMGQI